MRVLLLQDEIYLPSLGGGIKANRRLLEALSGKGHDCTVICPALTSAPIGPNNQLQFMQQMGSRRTVVRATEPHVFSYSYHGVHVNAINFHGADESRRYLTRRIRELQPDWVLVSDDKRRVLLEAAIEAAPDRVVLLLQTIVQLPFGPLSVQESDRQTELMHQARAVLVISSFMKEYIRGHTSLESRLMRLPVYGDGPFPTPASFDQGYITLINPCGLKGAPIFLALARQFPELPFAAVPTWGTDDTDLHSLRELPNVHLLEPAEEIDVIFAQTRVLLVPSLWPETFGYVVPEAMLRGIPVLASDIGGLREAKLGVDYLLPVTPAERKDGHYVFPPQDIAPWSQALRELLSDRERYERCSQESRQAALSFVATIDVADFEQLLAGLAATPARAAV